VQIPPNLKVSAKNGPITGTIEADVTEVAPGVRGNLPQCPNAGAYPNRYEIEEQSDGYVFRVRDDGKGVKKEVLPRIFDPFFYHAQIY